MLVAASLTLLHPVLRADCRVPDLARFEGWFTAIAVPFTAIAAYGPVSLPAAVVLYRDGAGYDQTQPAAAISVLVGLGFVFAARHLLLLSAGRLRAGAVA